MYIGPWQEFRLAKLHDNALQKLKTEWEVNIRSQLAEEQRKEYDLEHPEAMSGCNLQAAVNEATEKRIRGMMEPLMAKLPARLLAGDTKSVSKKIRPRNRPSSSRSGISDTESFTSKQSDRDSHRLPKAQAQLVKKPCPSRCIKKKRRPQPPTELEKRKRMYASWLEEQSSQTRINHIPAVRESNVPFLPEIQAAVAPMKKSISALETCTALPPIHRNAQDAAMKETNKPDSTIESTESTDGYTSEGSINEDEVNALLSWTNTLLSPDQLDNDLQSNPTG